MIHLTDTEKQWILLAKGQLKKKYPYQGSMVETAKPLFAEIYGWDPTEFYNDYLVGLFNKLLDIQLKISDDHTGCNGQLKGIFNTAFTKTCSRDEDNPIERSIGELFSLLQFNTVKVCGLPRYELFK